MNLLILTLGTDSAFNGIRSIIFEYSRPGTEKDIIKFMVNENKIFYHNRLLIQNHFMWMSNFEYCWKSLLNKSVIKEVIKEKFVRIGDDFDPDKIEDSLNLLLCAC